MLEDLDLMANTVTNISVDQATTVVDAVNRRLFDSFYMPIIRCYWRSESEGGSIFSPVTSKMKKSLPSPKQFEINDNLEKGFISWVFENKRSLWINNIQEHFETKQQIRNLLVDNEFIDSSYFWSRYKDIDCAYIFPFIIQGQVKGFYILEGEKKDSIRFNNVDAFEYVEVLVRSMGILLDRAYDTKREMDKRNESVRLFLDKIREYRVPKEIFDSEIKTCFIARSFEDDDCKKASEIITKCLENKFHIKSSIFRSQAEDYIVDGISRQISDSHFCIVDITKQNPNVMFELGMMVIINKPIILIKNKGDNLSFPFNINQRSVHQYEIDNVKDIISLPQTGTRGRNSLEGFFFFFLENVKQKNEAFTLAKDYFPEKPEDIV